MSVVQSAPALLIGILALVFTIFSFWWMNWRKGKLIIGPPLSYALTANKGGLLLIVIPLIFYNDGAATQVIQNLRLTLEQNDIRSKALNFVATVPNLLGGKISDGTRLFACQFAIEGRKSYSDYFEFQRDPCEFVPSQGKCKATLEAKLNDSKDWKTLCIFYIYIRGTTNLGAILPYNNDPDID
jgi:hypothetical protein